MPDTTKDQNEEFYDTLLKVSGVLTSSHTRHELLQTIYDHIHEIFPFDDTGLFTLDETGEHHIDWIVEDEITKEGTELLEAGVAGYLPHKGSVAEGMMMDVPTLLSFEEINKKHPGHPQYALMKQQGIKQFICKALFRESKKIGMLCFNSKQEDFYSEKDFRLFDSIANQVNVAVLNILANEEILRREQEKASLLKISEAIASIKSREDLLKAMLDRIKPLVDYEDAVITIYESDCTHYRHFVSSSPKSRKKNAQYHEIMGKSHPLKGTPDEHVLKKLRKEGILFWETKAMKSKYPKHFIPDFLQKHHLHHNLYLRLVWNNELIGFLHFHFNDIKKANTSKSSFYQSIADQLSATVANIIANEQLIEEKQFKETLLGISEAVASINDRQQLLKVIFDKVNPLIPIDDVGVIVTDPSGEFWYDLAVTDNYHKTASNDGLKGLGYDGLMPMDSLMRYSFEQYDILDIDTLRNRFPDNIFLQKASIEVMNFEEYLFGPMNVGGKNIGSLYFDAKKRGTYNNNHLPLFRAIADQLAVAVSNILANEQVLKEKKFKETLLNISETVSAIQGRKELLETIFKIVKPAFPFDSTGLFVFDETGDYHIDLTVTEELVDEQDEANRIIARQGLAKVPRHPSVELFMEKGPMIYLKDDLKKDYPDHPYYPYMKQKIMIGGPLINAGKPIGTLFFLSMDENAYSHEDFTLFKAISDQLAVAVSNVLAHEQLLEEKHISETLLSIGEGIATLRSKKDLINYIVDKLKPLFGFHDTGIIILDQHKEKYTDWSIQYTINTSEKSNKVFSYYEDPSGWNPVKNSSVAYIINEIDKTNKPTVFEWNGDWDHFSDNKLLSFSRGYDQSMVYLLKTGNVVLGTFWMNYQKGFDLNQLSLPLFQGICDQLAVAISNILANEQILEEKKLTEQLLEITESIAQIQDAYTLFKVIKERVQPIFDFELFDIVLLMEDNYSVVYYDPEEVHPDTVDFFENTISIDGSPFEEYFEKHPDTLIASIDDWLEKYPNYKGLQLVKKQGYSHLLLHKLHYKGELLGCIEMGYNQKPMLTKERIDLLNNFTQQVVLSVVNILSNENLVNEKRTTETLLSISEGISYIRSKKELLSYIIEKLKPIFNFYDTGILVLDKEKKQYTDWSAFYQVDDSPANLGIFDHYENQTIWNPYAGSGVELTIMESDKTSQPIIFDWNKDWSHLSDSKIMVFLKGHDYDRSMVYPFKNGSELLGAFWINFRKKDNIDQVSKPLFQGISDQLAVTISNILANEEIERRERLKSLQVETVSIFNQDKDWDERFEEFIKALQPHIPFHFASIDLWDDAADYNRCKNIERIGSNEYRLWGQDDFERASGVTKKESSSAYSIARNWHFEERKTPVSQSKAHKTILKILNKIMDIEQHIDLSIALQGDRRFLLSLYKKGTAPYNSEQASLLQELSDSLGQTIEKALIAEKVNELNQQLVEEKAYLQEEVKETYGFEEIVGKSEVMQKVFEKVSEVSAINATVLILGETGTGKELIARAIHNSSPRRDRVLVKVNCAAIPSQIVESELFGHEKGAFTGAIKQRVGKFELANHGTIFLDEIGDMPMELQAKLLRVLQEREVERVGSNTMIKLDFRVISATNKNLEELVAAGKFRADLFYRLNTFPLYLPALREREKDSELLAKHFARQFSQSLGLPFKGFSKKSLHNISTYEWPGNVRELQNVIEQAMILQKDKKLDISPHRAEKIGGTRSASAGLREIPDEFDMEYINAQKENLEKEYLMHVLEKTKWRVRGKGGAAELLDVHPNSLDYYLKKLGISKK